MSNYLRFYADDFKGHYKNKYFTYRVVDLPAAKFFLRKIMRTNRIRAAYYVEGEAPNSLQIRLNVNELQNMRLPNYGEGISRTREPDRFYLSKKRK